MGVLQDKLEIYSIDEMGHWNLEMETVYKKSAFERLGSIFKKKPCIDDALTNYGINDIAQHISSKYLYASIGISDSSPTDYTLNDLVSPVMTRMTTTNSLVNTYSLDANYPDTAQFVVIVESDSTYDLIEYGIHTASTAGYMGARQVASTEFSVTSGETFGMIWKVICGRG